MREIKFRGKTVDTGNWVYGSYQADVMLIGKHTIIYSDYDGYYCEEEVIPETIGQYTGLNDRNGKEIYEGDILKLVLVDWSDVPEDIFTVSSEQFVEDVCYLKSIIANAIEVESQTDCIEVIGNIYDNPELLGVNGK